MMSSSIAASPLIGRKAAPFDTPREIAQAKVCNALEEVRMPFDNPRHFYQEPPKASRLRRFGAAAFVAVFTFFTVVLFADVLNDGAPIEFLDTYSNRRN